MSTIGLRDMSLYPTEEVWYPKQSGISIPHQYTPMYVIMKGHNIN